MNQSPKLDPSLVLEFRRPRQPRELSLPPHLSAKWLKRESSLIERLAPNESLCAEEQSGPPGAPVKTSKPGPRAGCRGVRYGAACAASRELVLSLQRSDKWESGRQRRADTSRDKAARPGHSGGRPFSAARKSRTCALDAPAPTYAHRSPFLRAAANSDFNNEGRFYPRFLTLQALQFGRDACFDATGYCQAASSIFLSKTWHEATLEAFLYTNQFFGYRVDGARCTFTIWSIIFL